MFIPQQLLIKKTNIHHIIKIQSCDQTTWYIRLIMYSAIEGMFTSCIYLVILKVNCTSNHRLGRWHAIIQLLRIKTQAKSLFLLWSSLKKSLKTHVFKSPAHYFCGMCSVLHKPSCCWHLKLSVILFWIVHHSLRVDVGAFTNLSIYSL